MAVDSGEVFCRRASFRRCVRQRLPRMLMSRGVVDFLLWGKGISLLLTVHGVDGARRRYRFNTCNIGKQFEVNARWPAENPYRPEEN